MKAASAAACTLLFSLLAPAVFADDSCPAAKYYRTGEWELTSTTKNSMMPQPMTNTTKHCVTPADVAKACSNMNNLSGSSNHGQDCKVTDFKMVGNHASWSMTCSNPRFAMQGHGDSTFDSDAYSGNFEMTANMPQGGTMQNSGSFKARRLGDCTQ